MFIVKLLDVFVSWLHFISTVSKINNAVYWSWCWIWNGGVGANTALGCYELFYFRTESKMNHTQNKSMDQSQPHFEYGTLLHLS